MLGIGGQDLSDEPEVDDETQRKYYEKRIDEGYFDEKPKVLADLLDHHVQNGTLSKESRKMLWGRFSSRYQFGPTPRLARK